MLSKAAAPILIVLEAFGSLVLALAIEVSLPRLSWADSAPTLKELKNTMYIGIERLKDPVKLVDGRWEGRPATKGSAIRPVVSFAGDFRLPGDLDGDGADEAVIFLNYARGGTGQLLHLALVTRKRDKIENVATVLIGDRVQIRDVRREKNRLLVDVVRSGPKDAMCCPGEVTTLGWTLEPGARLSPFIVTASPTRLSLETIGNTEWVLRSWEFKQPGPTHPGVTLVFEGGRFTGSSGCNNYFAPAKERTVPGDVEVGPAATTRKSCPDNEMAVETRFLDQLVRVKKFGFLVTQLALSWEKDGAWKTMLFDKRAS
jgi:heat shock protein HslJ